MDAPGLARLAAARTVALYLLSLLAAAGADLAWRPPDLPRLAAHAVALGLAVGLGSLLPDALSAVGAAGLRARARLLAFLFLPLPALLALAVAVAAPASPHRPPPPSPSCRWPCSSSPKPSPSRSWPSGAPSS